MTATDDPLAAARRRAREHVEADPGLTAPERETQFRTARDRDDVTAFTEERGVASRLLAHPAATVQELRVDGGDGADAVEYVDLEAYDGAAVYAVRATFPVGCLTVARNPRAASATHADMITASVLQDAGNGGEGA